MECLNKIATVFGFTDVEKKFRDLDDSSQKESKWEQLKEEGNVHYKNSRWTEAMDCYSKAIRINPKVAILYSNRALCELQLGKLQLARKDAENSKNLDPTRIKTHRILSEALFKLSLFKEATDICQDGLKINPRDEVLLLKLRDSIKNASFLLGMNYLEGTMGHEKDLTKAEENLRKASELSHPNSDFVLGQLLLELTKSSEGLKFIQKAAEGGGNPKAELTLAFLFAFGHGCQRDPEQARCWFHSASKASKIDVEAEMSLSSRVVEFETSKKLSILGMTIQDRLDRFWIETARCYQKELKGFLEFSTNLAEYRLWPHRDADRACQKVDEMNERAVNGSKTAQKFIDGWNLVQELEENVDFGFYSTAFRLLIKAVKLWDRLPVQHSLFDYLSAVASESLEKNPRDAEALYVVVRYHAAMSYNVDKLVI